MNSLKDNYIFGYSFKIIFTFCNIRFSYLYLNTL
jgi:hypothetical protein